MCDNPKTPYLTYPNDEKGVLYWFKSDCKLWSCLECADKKRTRVSARVSRGVKHWQRLGLHVDFITLTSASTVRQFGRSIAQFRKSWPKLRKKAQYHNEDFHYALFGEQHQKNNTLHVHLVATNTCQRRWWKDAAFRAGLGYIADVRPVDNCAGAAKYATKYLSKSAGVEDWPTSFHRFRFSSRWPAVDNSLSDGEQWSVFFTDFQLNDELSYFHTKGYKIVNTQTGVVDG